MKKELLVFLFLTLTAITGVSLFFLNEDAGLNAVATPISAPSPSLLSETSDVLTSDLSANSETVGMMDSVILFYGEGCPHCTKVDNFLKNSELDLRLKIQRLEVFGNKENSKLMNIKAKECGYEQASIGVPFLWTPGGCYEGDTSVINYLKQF